MEAETMNLLDEQNVFTMEELFDENGPIKQFKSDYKPREAQVDAAKIISDALASNGIAVIEGETGMGKSFAYLFPVINEIIDSGFDKKAVIVTSGISLQEQLSTKDVPFVTEVMKATYPQFSKEFRSTILKGRQNFLCKMKIDDIGILDMKENMVDAGYREIRNLCLKSRTGDLSELDFIPTMDVIENTCCTKQGECTGKACAFFDECFYTRHKRALESSNIIITNYHMLFSDMKTNGLILPNYDILVFDEAHEAVNIFRDFDACKLSVNNAMVLRNKASELSNLTNKFPEINPDDFKELIRVFEIAFQDLDKKYPKIDSPILVTHTNELPSSLTMDLAKELSPIKRAIYSCNETYMQNSHNLSDYSPEELSEEERNYLKCGSVLMTMSNMIDEMCNFVSNLHKVINDENIAMWIERINDTTSLNYKKVDVGEVMAQAFFGKENLSTIFTSATISVAGSFEYVKNQLGIDRVNNKKVFEFIGLSPFNLTEQQLWYLPQGAMNGNDFNFNKTIASNVIEIIRATRGGCLCLFTSIGNMRNVHYELQRTLGHEYDIYVQGQMPRMKLIDKFKENRDSILLGTKSFFTGVDVPGDALRCVIIDKFPFPQPTDPIQQKLKERDNSFYKYSIPEMIITLKQAVGRGVRSVDDRCVIAILDGRMSTAKYKTRVNNSFNYQKTGTRNIDDVKEFFKDLPEDDGCNCNPCAYVEDGECDDIPF